ncbi:MAG: invasin domain 3-containing protein, partial [Patescibacteria group bacterium]
ESSDVTDGNAADGFPAITLVASSGTATIGNADYAAAATTTLTLTIAASATGNTAITVTPTYAVAGAGQIDDVAAANNEMADAETVAGADGAAPIVTAVALSLTSSNVITFTYSEVMTVTNGASTATKGDTTVAGTVAGFGSFATAGNVTVATVKNTVGGNGTTVLTVTLANEAASYLAGTSTTEPSGVFTPVGSAEVKDAVNLQVNTVNTPTTTGGGSWDLAKPTITSVTVSDAASNDGKIDRAVLVLNSAMRDANVTDSNGALGGLAGTFTTGAPNDATTTFNITDPSTQPVNTALGAHTSFLYSGATTLITDLVGNLLDTTVDGQIAAADIVETDGAQPIVTAVALSLTSNRDVITFTYSEAMTVTNGASATGRGDITGAGVVGGFGTFATTGNVTVPTTKNTVGGSGTTALTVTLANEATGYMNNTSTTEPSGVFTPATSVQVVDAASNQVNNLNAPTATGGGTWDLTKPTITSATVSDASGSNGKVDRAVLVLNSAMRDANVTDSNGALGGLAGTFTTGTANDATTTFNLTSDAAQPVNTALGAHTQFNYTGATTFLIDLAGNLLDTVSDGAIADGDIVETDGAVPILVSATYRDLDSNGAVDTLRTTWSENVTMTGSTAVDWTIVGGSITAAFSAAANDAVAGTTLDVTVTADANETSSGVAPTIAYDNDDVNNSVVDGATNAAGTNAAATATDAAAPAVATAIFYDASPATNDGKLDRISVIWSENISAVADGSADWAISSAANFAALTETAVICNSGAAAVNECRYTFTTTTVKTNVGDLSLAYTAGTSVTDGTNTAASKTLTSASSPPFTDGANPVVASTSPADGATSVALDASFSITFSEAMTTTDITTTTLGRSPTFTLGSAVWSSGDTVVTYASHDAWAGLQIYTIDLVQGSINSAALLDSTLDNSAIVADPYTFTTVAASGGGGGGGGGLPASVTVTTPNGGETLTGGGTYNVTWSAPGVADTINLYYSLDSGINFPNTIATAQTNDGSYTWTVPNISSSTVKVKAVSGSLSDISDANLAITYTTPTVSIVNSTIAASPTSVVANGTSFSIITVTVKDAASVPLSGKVVTLASSRGTTDTVTTVTGTTGADGKATFNVYSSTAGTSTYTVTAQGTVLTSTVSVVFTAVGAPTTPGTGETPTSISVGDLIKSPLSTSVYYYGSDNKRHVFPNEKTYKSWYVDFSGIKSVTASQLQGIALGANVKVRPGTVLVKIDTDPKVYAVEPSGLLRWVPTEARALTLYGSAWASRIIDVPLIFWVDYSFGSDITTDAHPTGALIQYTGTTDKYYIQGAERRLISTAGFTANKFQLSNVLAAPTTISYTLGTPITAEDTALTRIY